MTAFEAFLAVFIFAFYITFILAYYKLSDIYKMFDKFQHSYTKYISERDSAFYAQMDDINMNTTDKENKK